MPSNNTWRNFDPAVADPFHHLHGKERRSSSILPKSRAAHRRNPIG